MIFLVSFNQSWFSQLKTTVQPRLKHEDYGEKIYRFNETSRRIFWPEAIFLISFDPDIMNGCSNTKTGKSLLAKTNKNRIISSPKQCMRRILFGANVHIGVKMTEMKSAYYSSFTIL